MAVTTAVFRRILIAKPDQAESISRARQNDELRHQERRFQRVLAQAERSRAEPSAHRVSPQAFNRAWNTAQPLLTHLQDDHQIDRLRRLLHAVLAGDEAAAKLWRKAMAQLAKQHRQEGEELSERERAKTHSPRRQVFGPSS